MSVTTTGFELLREALESHGFRVTGAGSQLSARCPGHDDRNASLSFKDIPGNAPVLFCHAGCNTNNVLAAVNLSWADLYPKRSGIDYHYPDGRTVHRSPQKKFFQSGNRQGDQLYRADRVKTAVAAGETVFVVEGEKDVASLEALGVTACCPAMGAGKAAKFDWSPLRSAKVVLIPDRDQPGRRHAIQVHKILLGLDATVEVKISAVGKDASDHVAAGYGIDDLVPAELPDEDTDDTSDGDGLAADQFELDVAAALYRLRVRDEAQRQHTAATVAAMPEPVRLDMLLAEPDEPFDYRIDRLWPIGGKVLMAAQAKIGKTTFIGNVIRSLADGVLFLGEYDPIIADGNIVLLDDELDRRMIRRWLRDQGVRNPDRVHVVPLRGALSSFNILDPDTRAKWAGVLRNLDTDIVVFDCLRPVLDSLGLDENVDAGRFLVAFDELLAATGGADALVVHHMGHGAERARGSSRLRDWPDAEWKLVRDQGADENDPAATRYFSAYGRDVDVPEAALHYEPDTRHLTLAGTGGRKDNAARKAVTAVLAWLDENPGSSGYAVDKALAETEGQKAVRAALPLLVADGRLTTARGARNATLYYPSTSSPRPPRHDLVDKVGHHLVTSSIGRGGDQVADEDPVTTRSADEVRSFAEPQRDSTDD